MRYELKDFEWTVGWVGTPGLFRAPCYFAWGCFRDFVSGTPQEPLDVLCWR